MLGLTLFGFSQTTLLSDTESKVNHFIIRISILYIQFIINKSKINNKSSVRLCSLLLS